MACALCIALPLVAIVIALIVLKLYLMYSMGFCNSPDRMDGKTVIVTGANAGLGYECAKELARRGARVIMACRNAARATKARDRIIAETGNSDVHVRFLDLMSLQSVRDFADDVLLRETRIDVLVNNAGAGGLGHAKTADGLPPVLQVNHYAPFLLTNLLLGRLKESSPSRIVTVSSMLHRFPNFSVEDINQEKSIYRSKFFTYNNSKLFNLLMSNELARKLEGTGVTSNCLHPGVVKTDFLRDYPLLNTLTYYTVGPFMKNASQGAQTQIFLSVDSTLNNVSGQYFAECRPQKSSRKANDAALALKVWDLSEKFVQLKDSEIHY